MVLSPKRPSVPHAFQLNAITAYCDHKLYVAFYPCVFILLCRWCSKVHKEGDNDCFKTHNIPDNLIQSLSACDRDNFPNLYTLLQIACILPVTSCEAERSFSALRRSKTCLRSCMSEDRLAALVLMNYHYSIQLNADDILKRFIAKHPRRLFSSITDWCSNSFWSFCVDIIVPCKSLSLHVKFTSLVISFVKFSLQTVMWNCLHFIWVALAAAACCISKVSICLLQRLHYDLLKNNYCIMFWLIGNGMLPKCTGLKPGVSK
jgi:hypothetical protein